MRPPIASNLSDIAGIGGKGTIELVVGVGEVVGGEDALGGKGMNAGSPVIMLDRGYSNARRAGGRNPA